MKIATLFSGIGAPEYAASKLGWEHLWCAEIEAFPAAVLKHHFPNVPNLGDVTSSTFIERALSIGVPDVIVAGAPCQAFSVAGLRNSLDDHRGNLTLRTVEIVDAIDPEFLVFENVPGIMSTKDNAFGCFLGALLGGDRAEVPPPDGWPNAGFATGPRRSVAWVIKDSQYYGVAQRRRRLWLVASRHSIGGTRNWRCAEALFPVGEGVRGDIAEGGATGEDAPRGVAEGAGECVGVDNENNGFRNICGPLVKDSPTGGGRPLPAILWPSPIAPTLNAHYGDKQGLEDQHALNGGGLFVPCTHEAPIAFQSNESRCDHISTDGICTTIKVGSGLGIPSPPAVAYRREGERDTHAVVAPKMSVRRLLPVECESLQASLRGWTDISYKGKPAADGPRYKALGNSMTTTVPWWIFRNLEATRGR